MSFSHFNRRLHLYLALSLMPWFLMYGLSSIPFSHPKWMDAWFNDGAPMWTTRFDRSYDLAVPANADLKPIGARIVKDSGLEGAFGTYRNNEREVNVYMYSFWKSTRLTYFPRDKRLLAEDMRFRWDRFLTGMHARGGFEQPGTLHKAWAVTVDLVCVGFLVWIASGLIMWWQLRSARGWGWLALGGGTLLFAAFLWGL